MQQPLFTLLGNSFNVQILLRTLLFLSIVYAVIRYSIANQRRQTNLEREFQNARELQQILVPETLPAIPGFTLTSAYRPAQEVGGDFFQIIPLEGAQQGSTLIVLGDVSGKGLQGRHDRIAHRRRRPDPGQVRPPAGPDAGRNQSAPARPTAGRFRYLHRRCCSTQMEAVFSRAPAIRPHF